MKNYMLCLWLMFTLVSVSVAEKRFLTRQKRFIFDNFKDVRMSEVMHDLTGQKVVSYTLARDTTAFVFVQAMWVTLHFLLWRGSADQTRREDAGKLKDIAEDKVDSDNQVDLSKIENFFMNPEIVTRNLIVCSGLFVITLSLWFLPSLLWKKQLLPGTRTSLSYQFGDKFDSWNLSGDGGESTNLHTEDKVSGLTGIYKASSLQDIYNRLLCPTCIVQIISINSMIFVGKLVFWSLVSSMPALMDLTA